jgi:hypothetical protein
MMHSYPDLQSQNFTTSYNYHNDPNKKSLSLQKPDKLRHSSSTTHNTLNNSLLDRMSEFFADNFQCNWGSRTTDNVLDETETAITATTDKAWSITKNDLKTIPPYYPIDRTSKVIKNTSVDVISERLSTCIKIHNIATTWSSDDPTLLHCSTNDFLKFEINLWKQDNKKNSDDKSGDNVYETCKKESFAREDIMIEIRRHEGDCVNFHRLKNALFDILLVSSEDRQVHYDVNRKRNGRNTPMIMSMTHKGASNDNGNLHLRPLALDNLMDVLDSVAMAYELIFNENAIDSIMGLQMLIFLTDSRSIHRVYAAHVSDFLLLGYDTFGNDVPAVRSVIFDYVVKDRDCIEHHYALQILTNIFQNSSLQQEIPISSKPEIEIWNDIIPALLLDIKNYDHNPHLAYNSIKCLRTWYVLAGEHSDTTYKQEIISCLEQVRSFGKQSYISLETESVNLMMALL